MRKTVFLTGSVLRVGLRQTKSQHYREQVKTIKYRFYEVCNDEKEK